MTQKLYPGWREALNSHCSLTCILSAVVCVTCPTHDKHKKIVIKQSPSRHKTSPSPLSFQFVEQRTKPRAEPWDKSSVSPPASVATVTSSGGHPTPSPPLQELTHLLDACHIYSLQLQIQGSSPAPLLLCKSRSTKHLRVNDWLSLRIDNFPFHSLCPNCGVRLQGHRSGARTKVTSKTDWTPL